MRILVTGASGFAGSLLVPRLLSDGHDVRALGRDPARVNTALGRTRSRGGVGRLEVLRGDALTGEGLEAALDGAQVAYYLIHSMESLRQPSDSSDLSRAAPRPIAPRAIPFTERERIAAHTFATAAVSAGLARIVYLGGLLPHRAGSRRVGRRPVREIPYSRHLASREAVERILLGAVRDSIALRASIVIGARSRSFRLLVRLVERLPVLTLPAWRDFRTQPIDARDLIEMLAACATTPLTGCSLDVGGPDVLTYGEMIARIAELMVVARPSLGLGVSVTPVTARLAAAIAGEDPELVLPLMEGLKGDLLPADDRAADKLNVVLHSFDSAVEHALREWEELEPLAAH
jgi:uncharacterized protein YbjT (DUF2867 family)